jgi:hypothetical protein
VGGGVWGLPVGVRVPSGSLMSWVLQLWRCPPCLHASLCKPRSVSAALALGVGLCDFGGCGARLDRHLFPRCAVRACRHALLYTTVVVVCTLPRAVRDVMTLVVAVVTAASEKKVTEAQIVKFHGKVCVCLQEALLDGVVLHSDMDTVMQMSKLKPVKL